MFYTSSSSLLHLFYLSTHLSHINSIYTQPYKEMGNVWAWCGLGVDLMWQQVKEMMKRCKRDVREIWFKG
jgi:hypothetical protein